MPATLLVARRPDPAADRAWLGRSLLALAKRFPDARVRVLVADVDATALPAAARAAPPAASFDALVLIERERSRWPSTARGGIAGGDDPLAWISGARGYLVEVRALRAPPPPRAAERSPGLVFAATAVRASGLSHAEFDAYWRDRHGPLALRHHAGLCGYEQLAVLRALSAGAPPIDGLALLHFASSEDFARRFYDSDAGREAIASDTRRFLDLARCEAALLGEWGVRV